MVGKMELNLFYFRGTLVSHTIMNASLNLTITLPVLNVPVVFFLSFCLFKIANQKTSAKFSHHLSKWSHVLFSK